MTLLMMLKMGLVMQNHLAEGHLTPQTDTDLENIIYRDSVRLD